MSASKQGFIMDCFIGSTCLVFYPIAVVIAVDAWTLGSLVGGDWISKAVWTMGSIYMPFGAATAFMRVGRWIER